MLDLPSGILPFLPLIFRPRLSNRSIKASKQELDEKKKKGGRKEAKGQLKGGREKGGDARARKRKKKRGIACARWPRVIRLSSRRSRARRRRGISLSL